MIISFLVEEKDSFASYTNNFGDFETKGYRVGNKEVWIVFEMDKETEKKRELSRFKDATSATLHMVNLTQQKHR